MYNTSTNGSGFAAVASQSKLTSLEPAPKQTLQAQVQAKAMGEPAQPRKGKGAKLQAKTNGVPKDVAQAHVGRYGKLPQGFAIPPAGNGTQGVYRKAGLRSLTPNVITLLTTLLRLGATSPTGAVKVSAIANATGWQGNKPRHHAYHCQANGHCLVLTSASSLGYIVCLTPAGLAIAKQHVKPAKAKQPKQPKAKAAEPAQTPVAAANSN